MYKYIRIVLHLKCF